MIKQPPNPDPAEPKFQRCEICKRPLATIEGIATAIHSGCALTGVHHELDACPSKDVFLMDAKHIYDYIDRRAV